MFAKVGLTDVSLSELTKLQRTVIEPYGIDGLRPTKLHRTALPTQKRAQPDNDLCIGGHVLGGCAKRDGRVDRDDPWKPPSGAHQNNRRTCADVQMDEGTDNSK